MSLQHPTPEDRAASQMAVWLTIYRNALQEIYSKTSGNAEELLELAKISGRALCHGPNVEVYNHLHTIEDAVAVTTGKR